LSVIVALYAVSDLRYDSCLELTHSEHVGFDLPGLLASELLLLLGTSSLGGSTEQARRGFRFIVPVSSSFAGSGRIKDRVRLSSCLGGRSPGVRLSSPANSEVPIRIDGTVSEEPVDLVLGPEIWFSLTLSLT
jgi:hypothetical protein